MLSFFHQFPFVRYFCDQRSCLVLPPCFVGDAGRSDSHAVTEVQTIIQSVPYYRPDMLLLIISVRAVRVKRHGEAQFYRLRGLF